VKCITNIILILGANFFETNADKMLFLLYTIPLMVVLVLIMLQEFYRRQVTDKLDIKRFLLQVTAGGALVPVLGILIVPAPLNLFSPNSAMLIIVGACSGLIGGIGARGLLECLLSRNKNSGGNSLKGH
jgi:uncharacterized membrane protein YoaK (UPF0700 family)